MRARHLAFLFLLAVLGGMAVSPVQGQDTDKIKDYINGIKDIADKLKTAADDIKGLGDNLSKILDLGKQLGSLIEKIIDAIKGSKWKYKDASQALDVKNNTFTPWLKDLDKALNDAQAAQDKLKKLKSELEKTRKELEGTLKNINDGLSKKPSDKDKKDLEKNKKDTEENIQKAKKGENDADEAIKTLDGQLKTLKRLDQAAWVDYHSLCYYCDKGEHWKDLDEFKKFIELADSDLYENIKKNNPDLFKKPPPKNSVDSLKDAFANASYSAPGSQTRYELGADITVDPQTMAIIHMPTVCVDPATALSNAGDAYSIDPKSILTDSKIDPATVPTRVIETGSVNQLDIEVKNQGSSPVQISIPPGLIATSKDGQGRIAPVKDPQLEAYLNAQAVDVSQQLALQDPVLGANPSWWAYMIPQVNMIRKLYNFDEAATKKYITAQLAPQVPDEKKSQIPAIVNTVYDRANETEDRVRASNPDPSVFKTFTPMKATIDVKKM